MGRIKEPFECKLGVNSRETQKKANEKGARKKIPRVCVVWES